MKFKEQAIEEAINWWIHDEYYYHNVFSNLEKAIDEMSIEFISNAVFSMFLKQYSVRRSLKAGVNTPRSFLKEIMDEGFYKSVKNGKTNQIDELHDKFDSASNNSVKSALSKFSALCNPSKFIMYDTRSRKGMHYILNNEIEEGATYKEIDCYESYCKFAIQVSKKYRDQELDRALDHVKSDFRANFLIQNKDAFKLRVVDKLCWLHGMDAVGDGVMEYNLGDYYRLMEYRK